MLKQSVIAALHHAKELFTLTAAVHHNGEKGAWREAFVADLLRPLLPTHFAVGSGIVVDAYGYESKQTDIIIHDLRRQRPILAAESRGVFPIDSVVAVVEIKSTLAASDYKEIAAAAARFQARSPTNPDGLLIAASGTLPDGATKYPMFALFAYGANANRDEVERLLAQAPAGAGRIALIGVLDKGVWWFDQETGHYVRPVVSGDGAGLEFLALLLRALEDIADTRSPFDIVAWLRA
jgi:uncharacterized protein DUF6602